MILRHKTMRGGTQTVRSTVYALNDQGYAEMSDEHAALLLAVPSVGWERYQPAQEQPKETQQTQREAVEAPANQTPALELQELQEPKAMPPSPMAPPPPPAPASQPTTEETADPLPTKRALKNVQVPERLETLNRQALMDLAGSLGVDTRSLRKASNDAIVLAIRSAKE
jgi:hypothetical protein